MEAAPGGETGVTAPGAKPGKMRGGSTKEVPRLATNTAPPGAMTGRGGNPGGGAARHRSRNSHAGPTIHGPPTGRIAHGAVSAAAASGKGRPTGGKARGETPKADRGLAARRGTPVTALPPLTRPVMSPDTPIRGAACRLCPPCRRHTRTECGRCGWRMIVGRRNTKMASSRTEPPRQAGAYPPPARRRCRPLLSDPALKVGKYENALWFAWNH